MTAAVAIILAGVAGYVDALARIGDGAFAANMTGNTVFLAIAAVGGGWQSAAKYGSAIVAFVIGAVMARGMRRRMTCRRCALATAAATLLVAAWLHGFAQLIVLAAVMGLQDAAVMHFGGTSINTVFITGDLVEFSDTVAGLGGGRSGPPRKALLLGGVWLGYVGGAAAGAMAACLHLRYVFDLRLALAAVAIGAIAAFASAPARGGDRPTGARRD